MKILVIGATGSIGGPVVEEALRKGHAVRALVRGMEKARQLPPETQVAVGDLTRPETLIAATDTHDAVVFTHGSDGAGKVGAETVDYGGVRNVLMAIGSRPVRIALMTAIGVTNRDGSYDRSTESHDWKRRAERLVRASGFPYTIVRPGWFDCNKPNEHQLLFLQGDTCQPGVGEVRQRDSTRERWRRHRLPVRTSPASVVDRTKCTSRNHPRRRGTKPSHTSAGPSKTPCMLIKFQSAGIRCA